MFHRYRSDPDVARFQSWSPQYSREEAERFVETVGSAPLVVPGQWVQLAIAGGAGGLVGDIGLGFRPDPSIVEVGFTIDPRHQGRGYATEAVAGVLGILPALGVAEALGITDERNVASRRVLEKVGMIELSRGSTVFKGEPCVEVTYRTRLV